MASAITVSVPARPSTPSEQFVAFIVNHSMNAATGTYTQACTHHTPTSFIITGPSKKGSHVSITGSPFTISWCPRKMNAAIAIETTASRSPFLSSPHGTSALSSR